MGNFFERLFLFKPILTREDAMLAIRDAWRVCCFAAVVNFLVAFVLGWPLVIDAVLFIGLGIWLKRSLSKIPAAIMTFIGALSFLMTLLSELHIVNGGRNTFLAAVVALASWRAWDGAALIASLARHEHDQEGLAS